MKARQLTNLALLAAFLICTSVAVYFCVVPATLIQVADGSGSVFQSQPQSQGLNDYLRFDGSGPVPPPPSQPNPGPNSLLQLDGSGPVPPPSNPGPNSLLHFDGSGPVPPPNPQQPQNPSGL